MIDDPVYEALRESERFMSYFAGETGGTFVGPGTPQSCLAQIRSALEIYTPHGDRRMICGACGDTWQYGMSCGQKDNGWPFQTCYPVLALSSQTRGSEAT